MTRPTVSGKAMVYGGKSAAVKKMDLAGTKANAAGVRKT
jgi:hypothetical protein